MTNCALAAAVNLSPVASAGHSFGEYCSLVLAGSLDFETALRLVNARGIAMQHAAEMSAGGMTAILGLAAAQIENAVRRAREEGAGRVALANFNTPAQIVISGDLEAVRRAGELCLEAGAKRVVPLNVSGAWHSELMAPAVALFTPQIEHARVEPPNFAVISNVDAQPYRDVAQIKRNLIRSVTAEVQWYDDLAEAHRDGPGSHRRVRSKSRARADAQATGRRAGGHQRLGPSRDAAFASPTGRCASGRLMEFSGRSALITGASRGIGRAIAVEFAAAGADLALVGRDTGALEETRAACREVHPTGKAEIIQADVAHMNAVSQAVEKTLERYGRLDFAIANAGQSRDALILRLRAADIDRSDRREPEIGRLPRAGRRQADAPAARSGRSSSSRASSGWSVMPGSRSTRSPKPACSASPSRWRRSWVRGG